MKQSGTASALIEILQERSHIADVLIVNGGLGPTSDDLSALAAAKACGVELVERADWLARMEAYFAERGRPMALPTASRRRSRPTRKCWITR